MMLGSSPAFATENKVAEFQASAEVENTCLIESNNINFGVVSSPLSMQGAQGELKVLCSKNTNYTIDLEYGGNQVQGGDSGYSTVNTYHTQPSYEASTGVKEYGYRLYKDGVPLTNGNPVSWASNSQFIMNLDGNYSYGDFTCNSNQPNKVYFISPSVAQLMTGTTIADTYVPDTHGLCNNGQLTSTPP